GRGRAGPAAGSARPDISWSKSPAGQWARVGPYFIFTGPGHFLTSRPGPARSLS
ncbi:hypothetical protein TorRG33x02_162790, partial [Trema orientale]